jgi:hypothetical protein
MAYTLIDDPSAYFQTATYTGTGSSHAITNDGNSDMQPDWVWIKTRSHAAWHSLHDSSRGATKGLFTNDANAEVDHTDSLTSFNSDGFTLGADNSGGSVNVSSRTYVGWQWAANGGTTASNTDGNTTTTVQANQDAGFSIVTYTGTGSGSQTMGHGLGVTPNIVLTKARSGTSNWSFNGNFGGMIYGTNKLLLNSTNALSSDTNEVTAASSTTFTGGGSGAVNGNNSTYVAYCFAEKQGYNKFGGYVGNGNADGTFIYTGFKPAWVMIKRTTGNGTHQWYIYDNKRDEANVMEQVLQAQGANAEVTSSNKLDFVSNGFKQRSNTQTTNTSGASYIYMAFAENPFTTSTGIPTTAR